MPEVTDPPILTLNLSAPALFFLAHLNILQIMDSLSVMLTVALCQTLDKGEGRLANMSLSGDLNVHVLEASDRDPSVSYKSLLL